MSIINYTKKGFDKGVNIGSKIFNNKPFQITGAAILAGCLISPLFVPFASLLTYGIVAAVSTAALGYPTATLAKDGVMKLFNIKSTSSTMSSSEIKKNGEKEALKKVDNGKVTGNVLVDALADKLRGNGLKVSTNWDEAQKVLKNLPPKYDHLKKDPETLRGFVYQGVIFLNPKNTGPDVPIHEYTHIWAEALRQKNPDEWNHIVSLLKQQTDIWKEVQENYPHLTTENEIADEVLATYSGRHGAERLKQYPSAEKDPNNAFKQLLLALKIFWEGVEKFFKVHYDTVDDISERVLYDFLRGENPNKHVDENKITLSDEGPLAARSVQEKEEIINESNINEPMEKEKERLADATKEQAAKNDQQDLIGKKVDLSQYDPLPQWMFPKKTDVINEGLKVCSLFKNGQEVGYAASYIVNEFTSVKHISKEEGDRWFGKTSIEDLSDLHRKIESKYFTSGRPYDRTLYHVASLLADYMRSDKKQFSSEMIDSLYYSMIIGKHFGREHFDVKQVMELVNEDYRGFDNVSKERYDKCREEFVEYTFGNILGYGDSGKGYFIPKDVVNAYREQLEHGVTTPQQRGAIKEYFVNNVFSDERVDALSAIKQAFWHDRVNICISQENINKANDLLWSGIALRTLHTDSGDVWVMDSYENKSNAIVTEKGYGKNIYAQFDRPMSKLSDEEILEAVKTYHQKQDNSREGERLLSDKQIHEQYEDFKVTAVNFYPQTQPEAFSGVVELEFPKATHPDFNDTLVNPFISYDNEGKKIAFDHWMPEDIYKAVCEHIREERPKYLIKEAIIERINNPSPDATFAKEQQDLIIDYSSKVCPDGNRWDKVLKPIWEKALQDDEVRTAPSEWKESAKEELNDLMKGIRHEENQGIRLK